jgi:hypothetical protein
MPKCLLTFDTDELGEFELAGVDKETRYFIEKRCYPTLHRALKEFKEEEFGTLDVLKNMIYNAMKYERTRLNPVENPPNLLEKLLKKKTDVESR